MPWTPVNQDMEVQEDTFITMISYNMHVTFHSASIWASYINKHSK